MNLRTLLLIPLFAATLSTLAQVPQEGNPRRERPGRPEYLPSDGQGQSRDRPGHDRQDHDRQGHDRLGRERQQPVIERWLNHLEQQNPAEHQRLTALREDDPVAFREEMRRQFARAREQQQARRGVRGNPPDFTEELAALRNARNDTERAQAREALQSVLAEHIDQRLAQREQRIHSIREELNRLEMQHQADKARREAWIEEALTRMLEE